MNKNIFQQRVVPDRPKILANEEIYVYVTTADNDNKGIAAFNKRDFAVPKGQVSLRWPMETLVKMADPTVAPSLIKVLPDEFIKTEIPVSITHPTTQVTYTGKTVEVQLNRRDRNAFNRPELVLLDADDFDRVNEGAYSKYKFKRKNPLDAPALVQFNADDFQYADDKIEIKWPLAYLGRPGLVDITTNNGLIFNNTNKLTLDPVRVKQQVRPKVTYGDWANKNDFVGVDGLAKLDGDNNIIINITKESVGLGKVENKAFAEWTYNDLGPALKAHIDDKVSIMTWDSVFNDWSPPYDASTAQKWFKKLEDVDSSLWASVAAADKFLGGFATSTELALEHPVATTDKSSYAFVIATDTYWVIADNNWVNTNSSHLGLEALKETDASALKADGTASVGASGRFVQSDHVHPKDLTKADKTSTIKLTFDDEALPTFQTSLSGAINTINVPYVNVAQHLRNWNTNGKEYYWAGSQAEFNELDLASIPNGAFLHVDDDEELFELEELVTKTELSAYGIPVNDANYIVPIIKTDITSAGDLVTLTTTNNIMELKKFTFGDVIYGAGRLLVENDDKIAIRRFTADRLVKTNSLGDLVEHSVDPDDLLIGSNLVTHQLVKAADNNTVVTWATGSVDKRPLASDGNDGVRVLNLTGNKLVMTDTNGGLVTTDTDMSKMLQHDIAIWQAGQLLITDAFGKVIPFNTEGVSGRPLESDGDGGVRLRADSGAGLVLISGDDGTITTLNTSVNDAGKILGLNQAANLEWVVKPVIPNTLPQTTQTTLPLISNPNGYISVFLASAPDESDLQPGYIYYY